MYNRYIPQETRYEGIGQVGGMYREGTGQVGETYPEGAGKGANGYGEGAVQGGNREGFGKGKGGLGGILGALGGGLGDSVGQTIQSLLKAFHLENIDSGDILLALIVLFLILEDGDDLDLIITLGLMILFSLGEQ